VSHGSFNCNAYIINKCKGGRERRRRGKNNFKKIVLQAIFHTIPA